MRYQHSGRTMAGRLSTRTAFVALAMAASHVPALAADIPTTVTASGSYQGTLSVINDGVFPPNFTPYNAATNVHDYPATTAFTFALGGPFLVNQITAAVDFNDNYTFTFLNGATTTGSYTYVASSGTVTFGIQNFTATFAPLLATSVVLSTAGGDGLYAVGEARFAGTPFAAAAVPEPATWAMMIGGFGLVGARLRRRRTALRFA